MKGQNGCPLISDKVIIGIHTEYVAVNSKCHVGRLIDINLLNNIKNWINEVKGYQFNIQSSKMCSHIEDIS